MVEESAQDKSASVPRDVRRAPVRWPEHTDIDIPFVNVVLSQFTGADEFIITFGQAIPPSRVTLSPEELEHVDYVPGRILFRMAVTAKRMREIIDVLEQNYARYEARVRGDPSNEDESEGADAE
jgi:hypothetical protein